MCLKKELRARPKTWKILELVVEETFNSYAKNVRHLRRIELRRRPDVLADIHLQDRVWFGVRAFRHAENDKTGHGQRDHTKDTDCATAYDPNHRWDFGSRRSTRAAWRRFRGRPKQHRRRRSGLELPAGLGGRYSDLSGAGGRLRFTNDENLLAGRAAHLLADQAFRYL